MKPKTEAACLISIHIQESKSVGESWSLLPSGDDDDGVTSADETTAFSEIDAILDASIDILKPIRNTGFYWIKKKKRKC